MKHATRRRRQQGGGQPRDALEHLFGLQRRQAADEQLRVYEETGGDFNAVVDMLMKNTLENVPENCFS